MDLNNYWQENKRFVAGAGIGAVLFAFGWYAIDAYLGRNLREQRGALARVENDLKEPMLGANELELAHADYAALIEACNALRERAEFVPRPEFRLEKGSSATSRYFSVFERVRDELRSRAGRAGVTLPDDLGMPAVGPTKEILIARHLEALDLIDQAVRLSIEAGVKRTVAIRVKLDPRILAGKPFDDVERSRVEFDFMGDALAMTRLFVLLQEPREGRALLVENAVLAPAQGKTTASALELTLGIAHTNRVGTVVEASLAETKPTSGVRRGGSTQ